MHPYQFFKKGLFMNRKNRYVKSSYTLGKFKRELPLHLMILPGLILVFIFSYVPMAGLTMAFQNFIPSKGLFGEQKWIGLENFNFIFHLPGFTRALRNTVIIAFWKILLGLAVPIIFALLLNEVHSRKVHRVVQTIVYLPYFMSWVILSGILVDILSANGIVNETLKSLGMNPVFFLGDNRYFRWTSIWSDVWKNFGYGAIVYLAAILGIDTELYEAAQIDGANRWKQTWHVTLPGMRMIVILMLVLSLGNVLNAGFDQIFNLYSPAVYESGDIIDTFVYRMGVLDAQYGPATAVGLFKSIISTIFISISYILAYRLADYRIF
ncbi:putative aldouronate transport system permease protein [Anaerocolumna jejuensis DSM 15929]|uniref:Putative aldouronate transport system permease protein n=2 Tax=Anaerocolumna TaxID=1843210 RepID=A0A1M6JDU3_9FIRM|nr:putative aldouronate transport system permease protein [Anaerocolumna jejuensis DSM 15929]